MHVYSTSGVPVGFVHGTTIHDLDGWPVGRIVGTRVHRFDGSYVGQFFKDMVVVNSDFRGRPCWPTAVPPRQSPPPGGFQRRVVIDYGHADAFHLLERPKAVPAGQQEATAEPMSAAPDAPKVAADAETVLVVDDERSVREMIGHALRELGFQVQEAGSGEEAVAMLECSRPQLVILDFLMPDMDGAEVARELSRLDPDLPIVFSTGHSALRALRNAAGSGVAVLPKPFSVDELDALLRETLAVHRSGLAA
jgi:two-component system, response regulator, stage 0 sporulation protein F